MATTLLLIRHGQTDHVGRILTGRLPGVSLNAAGRAQADALADRLASVPLAAVYASPLERTRETATRLAAPHRLPVLDAPAFFELDFGDWTGLSFSELDARDDWRAYNRLRASVAVPGGEPLLAAQARAVAQIDRWRVGHPDQTIAVVSHLDILRAVLAHALGFPLDHLLRLDLLPCSVSVLRVTDWAPLVLAVNFCSNGLPNGCV